MARIPLMTNTDGLTDEQAAAFEWLVESRGRMLRPFEVLLHQPELARASGELGATIRFGTSIPDADRELIILATGKAHGCEFVWDSHLDSARAAGVRPEAIRALAGDTNAGLTASETDLVGLVRQLRTESAVVDQTFQNLHGKYGTAGFIELTMTIGYYTMLGYTMSAAGAC